MQYQEIRDDKKLVRWRDLPNVERWKATWGIFWRLSLAYGTVGSIIGVIAAATQ